MHVSRDELTVAKSRPEFETVNMQLPASWFLSEFFVQEWSVSYLDGTCNVRLHPGLCSAALSYL